MVLLEAIVIFILAGYAFWIIGFPIILDIIWIKRVRSGKRSSRYHIHYRYRWQSPVSAAIVHYNRGIFWLGIKY